MGFMRSYRKTGLSAVTAGMVLLAGCSFSHPHPTLHSAGLTPDASPNGIIVRAINPFYNKKALPYELPYTIVLDSDHPYIIHCEHNRVVKVPSRYRKVVVRFIGRENGYVQSVEVKGTDWNNRIDRRFYFHPDLDRFLRTVSPVAVNSQKGIGIGNYINGCTDPLLILSVAPGNPKVVNEFTFMGDFIQKVLDPQSPLKVFSFLLVD
ncbi:MAG: hypothetical protein M1537_06615 [Nitrospirae bacterium]|nr:hypothetical protein [Nitrospirota bacterium]MCL5285603.1 hypothetical protein [Nitrospirota bacterium]